MPLLQLHRSVTYIKFYRTFNRYATRDLYTIAMQVMLRDSSHRKHAKASTGYMDMLKVAMEGFVLNGVFSYFAEASASLLSADDETLNRRTRNLQDVAAVELGLPIELNRGIKEAAVLASEINKKTTPMEKVGCLDSAFKRLCEVINSSDENGEGGMAVISADEMVPMLALVVIHSDVANWHANLCFMTQAAFSGVQADELAYLLVSLEAAISHVSSEDFRAMASSRERTWSEVKSLGGPTPPSTPPTNIVGIGGGGGAAGGVGVSMPTPGKSAVKAMFMAVKRGNMERVKKILGQNRRIAAVDAEGFGCHPLCECAKCTAAATDPGAATVYACDPDGRTALHIAASMGHVDIVQLLLDKGAKVDCLDHHECTPLHLSCDQDNVDTSLILLMQGANVNVTDNDGRTPLHYCAARGHERCAKVLTWQNPTTISLNTFDSNGNTPLHLAAKWGFVGLLKELLFYDARRDLKNVKGLTPADCAHSSIVKELLDGPGRVRPRTKSPAPNPNSKVSTEVRLAASSGAIADSIIRSSDFVPVVHNSNDDEFIYVGTGADAGAGTARAGMGAYSKTPPPKMRTRSDAVSESDRRHSIATILPIPLKQKKPLTKSEQEQLREREQHLALLFEAVEEGDVELVRFKLFSSAKSGKSSVSTSSKSTLLSDTSNCHPLCQCDKCLKIARAKSLSAVDASSATAEGQTALHVAALHGQADVARMLLEEGVNPNPWNMRQHTPLHFACQYNHPEIVEMLLAARAELDSADHGGNTPLHFTCANGHVQCARLILDQGCNVDAVNFRGETGLHNASRWGYVELVGVLLTRGAKIDLVNQRGKTALQECHNVNIIQLIKAKAVLEADGCGAEEIGQIMCTEVVISNATAGKCGELLNGAFKQIGTLLEDQSATSLANDNAAANAAALFKELRRQVGSDRPVTYTALKVELSEIFGQELFDLHKEEIKNMIVTWSKNPDFDVIQQRVDQYKGPALPIARPVFEKRLAPTPLAPTPPPLALYFSVDKSGWVVSNKIGSKLPLAIAHGDVMHPGLLSATWRVLSATGNYEVDLDMEINNRSDIEVGVAPTQPINPVSWPHLRQIANAETSEAQTLADLQAQTKKKKKTLQTLKKFDGPPPLNAVESTAIHDRSAPNLQEEVPPPPQLNGEETIQVPSEHTQPQGQDELCATPQQEELSPDNTTLDL